MSATLMDFDILDEMWEDFEDWSQNPPHLRRMRKSHQSFRKMWDGIKKAEYNPQDDQTMPMSETIINELRRQFPKDEGAQNGRPLGDFKDIMESGHQAIYEALCEQVTRKRRNKDGEMESFLTTMKHHSDWLWEKYFKDDHKWINWNLKEYSQGVSLMLYSSSIGIWQENRVHDELTRWVNSNEARSSKFSYERADAAKWESKDVDGIFRSVDTGEVIVKVSIKCNRALEWGFIEREYRKKKKKTDPDIYIGYHTPQHKKLDQIEYKGNLKQLLRKALNGTAA